MDNYGSVGQSRFTAMSMNDQLDPIEDALLELLHAQDAGVFTNAVHEAQLPNVEVGCTDTAVSRSTWPGATWLAVAATLALSVGLGAWLVSTNLSRNRAAPAIDSGLATMAVPPQAEAFQQCFAGPTMSLSEPCRKHDYDSDGDVDIADFGAFQLAYATPRG